MKNRLSPLMRRRLLFSSNSIARIILGSALRKYTDESRADLRSAFRQFVDIAICFDRTHPPRRK